MWNILLPCQILLVQHGDCGAALTPAGQLQIIIRQRLRGIEHRQHKARLVQLFPAAADTLGLDGIPFRADLAHTGGVKQIQSHAAQLDGLLDNIAGRASHRRDDGAIKAGQQVQKRAFADIGAAQQHAVHTMAQHRTGTVAVDQRVQFGFLFGQGAHKRLIGQFRHILLRVIDPCGQVGVQRLQRGLYLADALCQPSVQCRFCQRGSLPAVRRNNLHHGLGLRQRHPAVFQCAAGELPRPGRYTACRDQCLLQAVCHRRAAVYRQLDDILAGVGMRRPEKQRHTLVHLDPVQQVVAQHGGVAFGIGNAFALPHRRKYFTDDGVGVRAGHADRGNAALTRWGRQRADGCMQFHVGAPFLWEYFRIP